MVLTVLGCRPDPGLNQGVKGPRLKLVKEFSLPLPEGRGVTGVAATEWGTFILWDYFGGSVGMASRDTIVFMEAPAISRPRWAVQEDQDGPLTILSGSGVLSVLDLGGRCEEATPSTFPSL